MDGMYDYLSNQFDQQSVYSVHVRLKEDEYDTDSLETDISLFEKNGKCNIIQLIKDKKCFDTIYDFVYDQKCMMYLHVMFCKQHNQISKFFEQIHSKRIYI